MKKILTIIILVFVSIAVQSIPMLSWWIYLVPIFLMGVFLPLNKWKIIPFTTGFVAGFLVWVGATIYYDQINPIQSVNAMARIVDINTFFFYLIIGGIGGLLSGMSLYSGYLLRKGREILILDLNND